MEANPRTVFMESLIFITILSLCTQLHAYYLDEFEDRDFRIDKRGGIRPYAFPCNGYDNLPRCLHGGKGPSKRLTKAGRFCVCLCPSKWVGPECSYATDNRGSFGKRADGAYGPWSILNAGTGKRSWHQEDLAYYDPTVADMDNYMDYELLYRKPDKRNMPWVILSKFQPDWQDRQDYEYQRK